METENEKAVRRSPDRQVRHETAKRQALRLVRELDSLGLELASEFPTVGKGFLGQGDGSSSAKLGELLASARRIINEASATCGATKKEAL